MDGLPDLSGEMPSVDFDFPDLPGSGSGVDESEAKAPAVTKSLEAQKMTKKTKAAIIVRLLSMEDVKLPLGNFSERTQVELAKELTDLRHIGRDTVVAVVEEFIAELEAIGLSFPGGLEGALSVLEGAISPDTVSKLRKQAGFSLTGDPWERIANVEVEHLLPLLEEESVEVCAVVLSKLKVAKSAQLLSMLPGSRARRVAYAISMTSSVSPGVVQRIGISVASTLDGQPPKAFSDAPTERVGAILNYSSSTKREEILVGLDETDKDFAEEVRRNIFTFANIAQRLEARDVPKVLRAVDAERLTLAMAGADEGANLISRDFMLENMSKRMADGLREEIASAGKVKASEAELAMTEVIGAIRELEAGGEITLKVDDESEED